MAVFCSSLRRSTLYAAGAFLFVMSACTTVEVMAPTSGSSGADAGSAADVAPAAPDGTVACGPGTHLDPETAQCVPDFSGGDEVQSCPPGYLAKAVGEDIVVCEPVQEVTLYGFITHQVSGAPIADATVTVYPSGDTTVTDASGYFVIADLGVSGDVKLVYGAEGFQTLVIDLAIPFAPGDGQTVLAVDASTSLGASAIVAGPAVQGTVYAGSGPADGAVVRLTGASSGLDLAVSTTAADGSFALAPADGASEALNLTVDGYDLDGDGVTDFVGQQLYLGDLSAGGVSGVNPTNLVIVLSTSQAKLSYVNFSPPLTDVSGPGLYTGLTLGSPTSDLVLHFGAEVDTGSLSMRLVALVGETLLDELSLATEWNDAGTVLTVDPVGALDPDGDTNTTYELRIEGLLWSGGGAFVAPGGGDSDWWLRLRFDVSEQTQYLPTPSPAPDLSNKQDDYQTSTEMVCDSRVCWLLDADGAPFKGWYDTAYTGSYDGYFNHYSGFDLMWDAVPGAEGYYLYVRQSWDGPVGESWQGWLSVDGSPSTNLFGGGVVTVSNVLAGGSPGWSDLGAGSLGGNVGNPLAFSNTIEIAVTAVNEEGQESPIDASSALALSDGMAPRIVGASFVSGQWDDLQETTEKGFFGVHKVIELQFSELMGTSYSATWSVEGAAIDGFEGPTVTQWQAWSSLEEEGVGESARVGDLIFDLRGQCTEVLEDASPDEDVVFVRDATFFVSGDVFFLDSGGGYFTGPISRTIEFVDYGNGTVHMTETFGANGGGTVWGGSYICAAQAQAGRSADIIAPGGSTLKVNDISVFHPHQKVLVYGVFGEGSPSLQTGTVSRVRSPEFIPIIGMQDGEVDLDFSINSYDSAVIMPRPNGGEESLREARELELADTAQTGDAAGIPMTASSMEWCFISEGDLVLIDVDGQWSTVHDRHFGSVTTLKMTPDNPSTGEYDPDYHLTLSAPPPLYGTLPMGLTLELGVTQIVHLADTFRVNGFGDTSGNDGLHPLGDQFSFCSGGTLGCQNGILVY